MQDAPQSITHAEQLPASLPFPPLTLCQVGRAEGKHFSELIGVEPSPYLTNSFIQRKVFLSPTLVLNLRAEVGETQVTATLKQDTRATTSSPSSLNCLRGRIRYKTPVTARADLSL